MKKNELVPFRLTCTTSGQPGKEHQTTFELGRLIDMIEGFLNDGARFTESATLEIYGRLIPDLWEQLDLGNQPPHAITISLDLEEKSTDWPSTWKAFSFSGYVTEWIFFHRTATTKWQWVELPVGMHIDEDGTIEYEHYGHRIRFERGTQLGSKNVDPVHPWPDVILNRGKYAALWLLTDLIKPGKENQITALIDSEQPFKLIGYQLKRKLEALWEVLA